MSLHYNVKSNVFIIYEHTTYVYIKALDEMP